MPSPPHTIPSQDLFVNPDVEPGITEQKAPDTISANEQSGAQNDSLSVEHADGWHIWSAGSWSTLLDTELSEVTKALKTGTNHALSAPAKLVVNAEGQVGNHGAGGGRAGPLYLFARRWMNSDEVFIMLIGILTHILTRLGLGWDWLLILLAFCATYYMTTMKRFRAHLRDTIARNLAQYLLAHTPEQAQWVNHLIGRAWPIYGPLFAHEIATRLNWILDVNCPLFFDSLHLREFTMGTKAIEVLQIRTYPETASDVVEMDWHLSFMPNQTLHHPRKGHSNNVIPRIMLSASISGVVVPVLVENVSLTGWLKVRIKLGERFPHVKTVDLSFMEKPVINHTLKPLDGNAISFDMAELHIPGLSAFIRDMIHSSLNTMYYPNYLTLDVGQMLPEEPLNALFGTFLLSFFLHLNSSFASRRRSE